MAVTGIIDLLAKVDMLSDLSIQELGELAGDFRWENYRQGTFLIQQLQEPRGFYILTAGTTEVFVNREGRTPVHLKPFFSGDAFGEIDLFSGKPSSANVRCLENCEVLVLDAEHFAYMLVRWPKLYQSFVSKLSDRLNRLNLGVWEVKHKEFLRSGMRLNQLKYKFYDIWGNAATTKKVESQLEVMADSKKHILLIGERGTGQQMMAWHIHQRRFGDNASFVVVDGGHFDQQWGDLLFELQEKTGANITGRNVCMLDMAEGGTLFIRDINLLSKRAQLKMATALQEGATSVCVLGSLIAEPLHLSVRLIPQLAEQFTVIHKLKPLREQKKDIPAIAQGVLAKLASQYNRKAPTLHPDAAKLLLTHNYRQGNVSELIDILERAFFLAEDDIIDLEHLFFGPTGDRLDNGINLLSWDWFGNLVKKGIFPLWLQRASFVTFVITILTLFIFPNTIASYGLLLVWHLWWPSLVVSAFLFGRMWCGVCPVSYGMELLKKITHRNLPVPHIIQKYDYLLTTFLFLLIFWVEAITNMRVSRFYTGWWLMSVFWTAGLFGIIFIRHTWCRHLCPLGGLIGIASIGGIVEVRADPEICLNRCNTHDCYRGTEKLSGCPMSLHAAYVDSNQVCKVCLRCVRNCPHDNVKVNLRVPAREVWHLVRVNQGFAIFIGVALVILIPITYFEPLRHLWPIETWIIRFSIVYWGTAVLAGIITWLLVRPFKTKAASRRIKLVFAFIPMVVTGFIAYQLHFFPGAYTILLDLAYKVQLREIQLLHIPILRVGQVVFALLGMLLTIVTFAMVLLYARKNKKPIN